MCILFELFANTFQINQFNMVMSENIIFSVLKPWCFTLNIRRKLQNLDMILPFNVVPTPQISWCHCFVMLGIYTWSLNGMKAVCQ